MPRIFKLFFPLIYRHYRQFSNKFLIKTETKKTRSYPTSRRFTIPRLPPQATGGSLDSANYPMADIYSFESVGQEPWQQAQK